MCSSSIAAAVVLKYTTNVLKQHCRSCCFKIYSQCVQAASPQLLLKNTQPMCSSSIAAAVVLKYTANAFKQHRRSCWLQDTQPICSSSITSCCF